jgi:hypothetical protein
MLPTVQEAAPVDLALDPLPLDVDAEVNAELDAEAPPEVGEKEIPEIAAKTVTSLSLIAPA